MSAPLRFMKACTVLDDDLPRVRYPLYASPKVDGIFSAVHPVSEQLVSRTLTLIPNEALRYKLERPHLRGLTGELAAYDPTAPEVFNRTTRLVRRASAASKGVRLYVFDYVPVHANLPFSRRLAELKRLFKHLDAEDRERVKLLPQVLVQNEVELLALEEKNLAAGYEGTMLRAPDGLYKFGRSTLREGLLLRRKPFEFTTAVLHALEQGSTNANPDVRSATGYAKRSSAKAGKVLKQTTGSLIAVTKEWGEVRCGCGTLTHKERQALWDALCTAGPKAIQGRKFRLKFQNLGTREKPRLPTFAGWL